MNPFSDYLSLWAGGRLALEGQNPYSRQSVIETLLGTGLPLLDTPGGFHNPPWSLWIFAPFSLLPLEIATVLWLSGIIFLTLYCLNLIYDEWVGDRVSSLAGRALILICFFPLFKTLLFGQTSHILLLGVVVGTVLLQKQLDFRAGLSGSLLFLKLHLFIPVLVYLTVVLIRNRRFRVFYGAGVGLFLQSIISFCISPEAFIQFSAAMAELFAERIPGKFPTIGHILLHTTGIYSGIATFFILAIITAVIFAFRTRHTITKGIFFLLAIGLITAPYGWTHDQFVLLPLFVIGYSALKKNSVLLATSWMVCSFALCIIPFLNNPVQNEMYLVWYPMFLMISLFCLQETFMERKIL